MSVRVKPLEWSEVYDNGVRSLRTAYSVGRFVLFVVETSDHAKSMWRWSYETDGDFTYRPDDAAYRSAEYAMAAADRWHARQVAEWVTVPDAEEK